MSKLFSCLLLLCLAHGLSAQDIIYSEGLQNSTKVINLNRTTHQIRGKSGFNWTSNQLCPLYIDTTAGIIQQNTRLPYFDSEGPASILNTGADRDIQPADGWVLVFHNFGVPGHGSAMPHFILYNKYRGLLRFFFYYTGPSSFTHARVSLAQPYPNKISPLFNYNEPRNFLNDYTGSTTLESITKVGLFQWSFTDFIITGYDPNPDIDATLRFNVHGITESQIALGGSLTLDQVLDKGNVSVKKNGTGSAFGDAFSFFKSAAEARDSLKKAVNDNPSSSFGMKLKPLVVDSVFGQDVSVIAAGIGFLESLIFGGKENAVQPLKFQGDLDLSGTIITSQNLFELSMRLPGAPISDPNDPTVPVYSSPLGIFNLNKPTMTGYFDYYCDYDDDEGDYICEYEEDVSLSHPLNVLINPHIGAMVTVRAGRVKIADLTNFYSASSFHNKRFVSFYDHNGSPEWTNSIALEITIDYSPSQNPIVLATQFLPAYNLR